MDGSDKNLKRSFISAVTKENVDELRNILYEEVKKIHIKNILIHDVFSVTTQPPYWG